MMGMSSILDQDDKVAQDLPGSASSRADDNGGLIRRLHESSAAIEARVAALRDGARASVETQAALFNQREREIWATAQLQVEAARAESVATRARLEAREQEVGRQVTNLTALIELTSARSVALIQREREIGARAFRDVDAARSEMREQRLRLAGLEAEYAGRINALEEALHAERHAADVRIHDLHAEIVRLSDLVAAREAELCRQAEIWQADAIARAAEHAESIGIAHAGIERVEAELAQTVDLTSRQITELNDQVAAQCQREAELRREIAEGVAEVSTLTDDLLSIRRSLLWRLAAPLGWLGSRSRRDEPSSSATPQPYMVSSTLVPPASDHLMSNPTHIEQLIALSDDEFIFALYRTLLDRNPDPEGHNAHFRLLRAGEDKLAMVVSMARSPEGRKARPKLEGLAEALKQNSRERGVFGPIYKFGNSFRRLLRQVNSVELRVAYIESQVIYRLNNIEGALQASALHGRTEQSNLEARFENVERALGILCVNNENASAAFNRDSACVSRIAERVAHIEGAVKTVGEDVSLIQTMNSKYVTVENILQISKKIAA